MNKANCNSLRSFQNGEDELKKNINKVLTHQSLPSEKYLSLLGMALCVFSSNNGFIIENILRADSSYSWFELIDKESGALRKGVRDTISVNAGAAIEDAFVQIVEMRNRIIHGFRITNRFGEQTLATKERKSGKQFEITEEYLFEFIKQNDQLSQMLHAYRGF